jgi:hypothetical protein
MVIDKKKVIKTNEIFKNPWQTGEFDLKYKGKKIDLLPMVAMRYRYKSIDEGVIPTDRDSLINNFYTRNTSHNFEKGRLGYIEPTYTRLDGKHHYCIDIFVPEPNALLEYFKKHYKQVNNFETLLNHIGTHEESHAQQFSGNYMELKKEVDYAIGRGIIPTHFSYDMDLRHQLISDLLQGKVSSKEEFFKNMSAISEDINRDGCYDYKIERHAEIGSLAKLLTSGELTMSKEELRRKLRHLPKDASYIVGHVESNFLNTGFNNS